MSTYTSHQMSYFPHSSPGKDVPRTRFERNPDGVVEYILKMDMTGFASEEISVIHDGLNVSIDASRMESSHSRQRRDNEYHTVIQLPKNTDLTKHIKAYHENDLLVIKMPIIPRLYSSSTYQRSRSGLSVTPVQFDNPSIYIHNVPIGDEFIDGRFSVNVEDYKAHVTIFKEYRDHDGDISRMEFNSEHLFPMNVAIDSLKAEVDGRTLILSAPYKSRLGDLRSTNPSSSSMFL